MGERTTARQVRAILDALESAEVPVWVGGGWGVDALAGEETRPHSDVDICIPVEAEAAAIRALESIGLRPGSDERPTRFVMTAPGQGSADVHLLVLFADGTAVLRGPGGVDFQFAAGSLDGVGRIDGRAVRCFTVTRQRVAHSGYSPREEDLWDLAVLDRLENR